MSLLLCEIKVFVQEKPTKICLRISLRLGSYFVIELHRRSRILEMYLVNNWATRAMNMKKSNS